MKKIILTFILLTMAPMVHAEALIPEEDQQFCYEWAVGETGIDPTAPITGSDGKRIDAFSKGAGGATLGMLIGGLAFGNVGVGGLAGGLIGLFSGLDDTTDAMRERSLILNSLSPEERKKLEQEAKIYIESFNNCLKEKGY